MIFSNWDVTLKTARETTVNYNKILSQTHNEFLRYALASLGALVVDVSVLIVLITYLEISPIIAGAIGFLCGLIFIYLISILWVFSLRKRVRSRVVEVSIFLGTGLVGLLLNEYIFWVLTMTGNIFYLYAKCVSIVIVFLFNFTSRKLMLFN